MLARATVVFRAGADMARDEHFHGDGLRPGRRAKQHRTHRPTCPSSATGRELNRPDGLQPSRRLRRL